MKAVLLLTDGEETAFPKGISDKEPIAEAQALGNQGVQIYMVPAASNSDGFTSQRLADEARGIVLPTPSMTEVSGTFFEVFVRQQGQALARHQRSPSFVELDNDGTEFPPLFHVHPIEVEADASSLSILIATRSADLSWIPDYQLIDPEGTPAAAAVTADPYYLLLRVSAPMKGAWQLRTSAGNGPIPNAPDSWVSAFVDQPDHNCYARFDRSRLPEGASARLVAHVFDQTLVAGGAVVSASVRRADKTTLDVSLNYDPTEQGYVADIPASELRGRGLYEALVHCKVPPGTFLALGERHLSSDPREPPLPVDPPIEADVFERETTAAFFYDSTTFPDPDDDDCDDDCIPNDLEPGGDLDGDGRLDICDGDADADDIPDCDDDDISACTPNAICSGAFAECAGQLTPVQTSCENEVSCSTVQVASTVLDAYPVGEFPFACSAVDAVSGQTDVAECEVVVVDTLVPEATCEDVEEECDGASTPVTVTCGGSDVCDQSVALSTDALSSYPLGEHAFTCTASDDSANSGAASCVVSIVDTAPPVITPSPISVVTDCNPDPHVVTLPLPTLQDTCGQGNPVLTGELIAVNGKDVVPAIPVLVDGKLTLRAGTAKVRWRAADASGNVSSLDQVFTVNVVQGSACCKPSQTITQGTSAQDSIVKTSGTHCVLGKGAGDFIQTASGNDLLMGQEGADNLTGGGGSDVLFGGSEADTVSCGYGGNYEAHGESGDDNVQAVFCSTAEIWGGGGNDNLTGSPGADKLFPGPGADSANAGAGNDLVTLYHACEAVSGKTLSGGSGQDTLVSPLSVSALQARGVTVSGFETVVIDASKGHLSECF